MRQIDSHLARLGMDTVDVLGEDADGNIIIRRLGEDAEETVSPDQLTPITRSRRDVQTALVSRGLVPPSNVVDELGATPTPPTTADGHRYMFMVRAYYWDPRKEPLDMAMKLGSTEADARVFARALLEIDQPFGHAEVLERIHGETFRSVCVLFAVDTDTAEGAR
jgi:hypothetical protein